MEQTKNEPKNENKAAPDNGKPKKERKPLTEAQRLKRQKMIVLPAMVLVFIGAMWLIFAPSSDKEQQPGTGGYNIEMPDADKANRQIIGDKAKAYEQGAMEERQENRNRTMQELGDMFDREVAETDGGRDFDLANPGGTEENVKSAPKTIQSSAAAYRDLNATLGNFYEQPKNDNADMDELLERIASLESELETEKGKASAMDDQVALMEKSYELAAKYMGGQNGTQPPVGQAAEPYPVQKAGKNTAAPVRQVTHQVVSSLSQPMSNAEFVASFSQERNRSFNTAVGVTTVSDRNTISACVYGAQSVTDGQAVKLRRVQKRIQRPGDALAVADVHRRLLINIDRQHMLPALLFKCHIPKGDAGFPAKGQDQLRHPAHGFLLCHASAFLKRKISIKKSGPKPTLSFQHPNLRRNYTIPFCTLQGHFRKKPGKMPQKSHKIAQNRGERAKAPYPRYSPSSSSESSKLLSVPAASVPVITSRSQSS